MNRKIWLAFAAFCFLLLPTLNLQVIPTSALRAQEAAAVDENPALAEHHAPKSRLWWFIESSGVIGGFIFCLSMYFVATSIRLYIELRPSELIPPEEITQGKALVESRNFQGLYDFLSGSTSLYAKLTRAGLEELSSGPAEAREVMDRHAEVETVDLERKISILAVLGTLGPMIGLIGTLKGMIASFAVIALSDTQMKASEVAGGISEALLLTFEGVALSIPAIYMYSVFRNRVTVYSAEALLAADQTIRKIVQASKTRGPAQVVGTR